MKKSSEAGNEEPKGENGIIHVFGGKRSGVLFLPAGLASKLMNYIIGNPEYK